MGRETVAVVNWHGKTGETKVLLEASDLILRGEVRDRIPRSDIGAIGRTQEGLALSVGGAPLTLAMAGTEADRWMKALTTAPPGLRSKLDIGPETRAYVLGNVDDEALVAALAGATTESPGTAAVLLAVLGRHADLESALTVALAAPSLPLWCVYGKGKQAGLGDAAIRTYLRARGYIDTKSCGVSERLTATRYARRA
jgi:hypothetical protein